MEQIKKTEARAESIRKRKLGELVDYALYRKDPELSYYFLILHEKELGPLSKAELVKAIAGDKTRRGPEFAFKLLRDQSALPQEFRDALIGSIVASGDLTTCSLTLQRVSPLGAWEGRLRDVLSR